MYLIYKRTNNKTGLSYIGLTNGEEATRWEQHLSDTTDTKLNKAIAQNRTDWGVEILEQNLTYAQAQAKEIYYIGKYDTFDNGYNSNIGHFTHGEGQPTKPVVAIHLETKEIKHFQKSTDARRFFGTLARPIVKGYLIMLKKDFNPALIDTYIETAYNSNVAGKKTPAKEVIILSKISGKTLRFKSVKEAIRNTTSGLRALMKTKTKENKHWKIIKAG